MEIKNNIRFELKELSDTGEFEGLASVFGNVDQGGDVVHPGAFKQTIMRRKGRVPLLRDHRTPVGVAYVEESADGLKARGVLNLDKDAAREVYSDLKFYREHDMPMGMSFGYDAVKKDSKDGVRNLREVKLYEVTLTEFPMNEAAGVTAVKSSDMFDDFMAWLDEQKAGRRLSAATRSALEALMAEQNANQQRIMDQVRALLGSEDSTSEAVATAPEVAKSEAPEEPAQDSVKPEASNLPLLLKSFKFPSIKEAKNG